MAKKQKKTIATLTHEEATRKNIPTAEHQSVVDDDVKTPIQVAYERRNRDLDPQLVWRGKHLPQEGQDESDFTVKAPPLYIQEKVHPKALIDELQRESREREHEAGQLTPDLFSDFNGLPKGADRTDFYQYDANWQNRLILGDSLQVMASLAEREGLRGKVQCIYLDPPYGIKFNSNFQWSTTSRDVKDGKAEHITREPEQVKAFRDTWRDGIHSYLTYLRDRLTVARDLLTESGSIFVQIGDENVHRVRVLMDEVFGDENFISQVNFKTTGGAGSPSGGTDTLASVNNFILWYGKRIETVKYRQAYRKKDKASGGAAAYNKLDFYDAKQRRIATKAERVSVPEDARLFRYDNLTSQSSGGPQYFDVLFKGKRIPIGKSGWKTTKTGMHRLLSTQRIELAGRTLSYIRYIEDFPVYPLNNSWDDTVTAGFASDKLYVVQTNAKVVERCLLMATDPGDLVLDPTCGSGTTATVAEQWGRRWITIDTSRVALALARARIMGARYPYYLLADSPEGQHKEAAITRSAPSSAPTHGNIAHGFVYQRVPHITLKAIANNAEIDVIWERFEEQLAPLREKLTAALPDGWLADYRSQQNYTAEVPIEIAEWEVPREAPEDWSDAARSMIAEFWQLRIARQQEIDASIAAKADSEYLYDKPYEDKKKVRVAGPFTVESISPHRVLGVDENDELIDPNDKNLHDGADDYGHDFTAMILDNLKTAGVQQAHKDGKITFTALTPWPGDFICADGRYLETGAGARANAREDASADDESTDAAAPIERRAAIFIGPEFGTVSRPDLVDAAREAADAGFDILIACAFSYEAHATEFEKVGRMAVLKARMNADLHMAADLKNTGKGNLFVIFGEPDIDIQHTDDNRIRVKVNGVDVFHPNSGEVRSDGPEGIACWFIDTDYNSESFFVRHAYFLGASDPYKSLRTTLKAEINAEAWETLHSDTSRAFDKPESGRIAVKVINHLGDEVMKVFRV